MGIEIKLDQALETIAKIKIPYLTIFLAFVSSYSLWFLTIYYFGNNFTARHGLIITLTTTYALTIAWILIAMLYVPKELTWYILNEGTRWAESLNALLTQRAVINLYIFANAILMHGFFMYICHIFTFTLFTLISLVFWTAIIGYIFIDVAVKRTFHRIKTTQKNL